MAESSAQCEAGARQDKGAEVGEKSFVSNLHGFMKERGTAIERIPHLGFKQSESYCFTLALPSAVSSL